LKLTSRATLFRAYQTITFGLLLLVSSVADALPEATAVRLTEPPVIDGDVQSDPGWRGHSPIDHFTQQRPEEGAPASQATEVFIGFTDTALYIGVVCHDDAPDAIIVANSQRDANLNDTDSFRVVIDTFGGRQYGFVFGTNPTGLEYDGQVSNESGSRFGDGGFDLNWDTSWRVAARSGAYGWSAEMEIPFTSLRYDGDAVQQWGFNFQRTIRRTNEVVYWAPLPRQYALNRLSLAGTISGIEVPSQRNLSITPYVLAKSASGGNLPDDRNTEFGFDAKYSLTPGLTLDATYNTDFAQVEVDQQQVNLNRFSLFFPEKRPFFQENASQFQVGSEGIQLFFSRRIGIGPAGEQVPIKGGLRLSGKMGTSTNIGLLAMQTEEVAGVSPSTRFAVARLRQELDGRSYIGMLVTDRNDGNADHRTWAVDGRWGLGEKSTVSGFIARTQTPGITKGTHAASLAAGYNSQVWSFSGSLTEVGAGFTPAVGFLARQGYRAINLFGLRSIRAPESSGILEYRPHASFTGYWDFDGFYETGRWHLDSSIEWKSGADLSTAFNHHHEGVKTAFQISSGVFVPAGQYDDWEFAMFAGTNRSAALRAGLGLNAGGLFGGDRVGVSPFVAYRPNEAFETSVSWNYNDVSLPGGDFDVGLTNFRISYSFSPTLSISGLIQYHDRDELLATNVRFSWQQSANTGLFIVYNETDDDQNSPGRPRRELILKYSHIVNVF
jgi:hypothetical protein